jgi:hypothetical protein
VYCLYPVSELLVVSFFGYHVSLCSACWCPAQVLLQVTTCCILNLCCAVLCWALLCCAPPLQVLAGAAAGDEVIHAVMSSLPATAATQGVPTQSDLEAR